jgi:hypothetical protein
MIDGNVKKKKKKKIYVVYDGLMEMYIWKSIYKLSIRSTAKNPKNIFGRAKNKNKNKKILI